MHVKEKYIDAVNNAIDFISTNVDGADEEHQEKETLKSLRELFQSMIKSQHKKRVSYYVNKK